MKDEKLFEKLIKTTNETVLLNVLSERTKYWFVVAAPDLEVRIFAISNGSAISDVTHEYMTQHSNSNVHHFNGYTLGKISFTTKVRPLIFVWYNAQQLFTDLFFVKRVEESIQLQKILPQM